jgi:hypothetical protein
MKIESDAAKEPIKTPIALAALAAETGFGANSFKRALISRGIVPFKLKQNRNAPYYVSTFDADAFKKAIDEERRRVHRHESFPQGLGGVYCIEVPSYDGRVRVKIGWADQFDKRLSTYHAIIPDLRILGLWPTHEQWMERAALARAKEIGMRVFTELFEFEDHTGAVAELNKFFTDLGVTSLRHIPALGIKREGSMT